MRRKRKLALRKQPLTEQLILQWADDHHENFGQWPTADSGKVRADRNENWLAVSVALRAGVRGLPGGSSLARLLAKKRNVRNRKGLPALTTEHVLKWADAYHARTGEWPNAKSGPIPDATPGETWQRIAVAIDHACRGFPTGTSLAWILAEQRGVGDYYTRAALSEKAILRWVDEYHRRNGKWPCVKDEGIPESEGDTWKRIDSALRRGQRGLKSGSSLAKLMFVHRGVVNFLSQPRLTKKQILAWADAHHTRTGAWPSENSGRIVGADGETWIKVSEAMRVGRRGFSPGGSLAKLLEATGRKRNRKNHPPFTEAVILKWADAHHRRTGRWPNSYSGRVDSSPEESWKVVDHALRVGGRGLAGGSSLLKLLMTHRGIPNPADPPHLTIKKILEWADEHHRRTGHLPQASFGPVHLEPGITWSAVNDSLRNGRRGLPKGSSLAITLREYRNDPKGK